MSGMARRRFFEKNIFRREEVKKIAKRF